MSGEVTYWDIRKPERPSFRRFLRKDVVISGLINLRAGTEAFLKKELRSIGRSNPTDPIRVLDIACGWGVSFAANPEMSFFGVDVKGFPKNIAIKNGYSDAREYENGIQIPYDDDFFDACTIINLNAHVPFSLYTDLLTQAKRKLRPGGKLLIVAELDNRGLSYTAMRAISEKRVDTLVTGMDHSNFVFEADFDSFLSENGVIVSGKRTIMGNILPFCHYTAWAVRAEPTNFMRYPAFLIDVGNSLLDNALTMLGLGGAGRRFLVGYVAAFSPDQSPH